MSGQNPHVVAELRFRRGLRRAMTPAERLFWELVRDRRMFGCKFRRQHRIGGWVVDFACVSKRLIVELDGGVHDLAEPNLPTSLRHRSAA